MLFERSGTSFTQTELINYHEPGYSYSSENGFKVAFLITDQFEPDLIQKDDLVKFEMKKWLSRLKVKSMR